MRIAALGIAAFAVSACNGGLDTSLRPIPSQWNIIPAESVAESEERWWLAFNDPLLNELVDAAARADDVLIAEARLDEAKARLRGARAQLAPDLALAGELGRERQDGLKQETDRDQIAIQAVWDVDLFGANRARSAAARAQAEAQAAELDAVRLSARATAARLYIAYRAAAARAAAAERSVAALSDALSLAESRRIAGLVSDLDVAQARAALAAARIPAASAKNAATEARLGLEALLGLAPGALRPRLESPIPTPQARGMGGLAAPVDVIARRPDLRAAERQLAAAGFQAAAARRDLFPRISLSALFGAQTIDPETPFSATGALWRAGAALTAPVLSFGRLEAGIDAADARQRSALTLYRQAAVRALSDVERALAAGLDAEARRAAAADAVTAARDQVAIARARYTGGLVPFLEVLNAEQRLFETEAQLAVAEGDSAAAFITLNEALGLGAAPISALPAP